jgi:hypothetical protein
MSDPELIAATLHHSSFPNATRYKHWGTRFIGNPDYMSSLYRASLIFSSKRRGLFISQRNIKLKQLERRGQERLSS